MKRICVISAYAYIIDHVNYGSLLQYFALERKLKELGYEPYWMRFVLTREKEHISSRVKKVIKYWLNYDGIRNEKKILKNFLQFISSYLEVSECIYDEKMLSTDIPDAEVFITGSDQVWGGILRPNYLCFVPEGKLKISYAASFGKAEIPKEQLNVIAPWIRRLDYISVRESSGKEICNHQIGVHAEKVLDPTLLIEGSQYPVDYKIASALEKFCFGYFLNFDDNQKDILAAIDGFSTRQDIKILYAACASNIDRFVPQKSKVYLSPEEWIGMYQKAEAIFTNTFHGTVFALIFHKKFLVFLQKGKTSKQNERILSLLQMVGLESRIHNGEKEVEEQLEQMVDWTYVDNIIEKQKEHSIQFLVDALERRVHVYGD